MVGSKITLLPGFLVLGLGLAGMAAGCNKHSHGLHPEGHMPHRFEDAEKWAKRFDSDERATWQKPKHVISLMKIKPGMVVADIGAGTGFFLPHLAAATTASGQVVGIDIEPSLVDYMNKRIKKEKIPSASARLGQAADPGLEAGRYDRVIIVNTWHHISARESYAKKLAAGLKPKGQLFIVDFDPEAGGPGPPKSHRLAAAQVEQELQAGGFKTEVISEELSYQYIVRAQR